MKTYYLEIVVGDHVHDVASVQADNYEGAAKIVDAAAKNRGFTGFALRETDEAGFIAFKNKKAEEANAAAESVELASESAAAEQLAEGANASGIGPDVGGGDNPDYKAPAEDNSESLAGDSQGVPVPEGNDAAQENPEEPAAGQAAGGSEQDADKAA